MLDQRRRRWADVVQMLHKCFAFAGYVPTIWEDLAWASQGNREKIVSRSEVCSKVLEMFKKSSNDQENFPS